jgi:hypothetical protein
VQPILFRVQQVMQPETDRTYLGWAWLRGYQMDDGRASAKREIYVLVAGLERMHP